MLFLRSQLILQKSNVSTFSGKGGGSNCLFPIETHITCEFPGGPDPLSLPLDPHLAAIYLDPVSQSAK